MGAFFETLPPSLVDWLLAQRVLWIASAPLSGDGYVNVSPKGITDKGGPFFGVIRDPPKQGGGGDDDGLGDVDDSDVCGHGCDCGCDGGGHHESRNGNGNGVLLHHRRAPETETLIDHTDYIELEPYNHLSYNYTG